MIRTPGIVAICTIMCITTAPALGAISAAWVAVASGNGSVGTTYPAAAITADPALLNMQTWDLEVTTSGNWASAGVRLTLPSGSAFYRSTNSGITKPEVITANREFWTYAAAPSDTGEVNNIIVRGGFPEGQPVSNGTANGTNVPGVFSCSWGDLVNDLPGTYQIARLTFPIFSLPAEHLLNYTSQVNPDATTGIRFPEPAAAVTAGSIVLLLCARRPAAARRRFA